MIRYLSEAEVERARPTVREGIDLARLALVALAEGRAQLPPKPSVYPRTGAFSNVMPAYVEDVGHGDQLGLKWVSVYNENAARGLPIINGIVLICHTDTGLPRTLMAAGFLTGIRTAAVSGACLEALAPADVGHVAITGAGVQTRSHLEICEELGHHRLVIDPAAHNVAAIRCYRKVGFRPVGVMRRYWRDPSGEWRDGLLMDLLAEELES